MTNSRLRTDGPSYGFLRPIIPEMAEKFLDECGDLARGFARIRCDHCKEEPPVGLLLQGPLVLPVLPPEEGPALRGAAGREHPLSGAAPASPIRPYFRCAFAVCLRLIRALAGTTRAANDVAGHCAVSGTLPLPYAGGKMREAGNGSDRYAMPRRSAKIGRSRRNLVPALLADPIRASEKHISTGLSNTLMSLNRHENWFNAKDAGQFTIVNGPYGVTLILCLSEPRGNPALDTELIASFRIDDKKTYSRPESTLIEALRMMPIATVQGGIVWSCPAVPDHHLQADEVISLLAEKLANYILRRLRKFGPHAEKENLKQALNSLARKLREPHSTAEFESQRASMPGRPYLPGEADRRIIRKSALCEQAGHWPDCAFAP